MTARQPGRQSELQQEYSPLQKIVEHSGKSWRAASWLLEHDVSQARSRMNLSRWNSYSTQQQEELLAAMGAAVRTQEMPPRRFTIMHPEAALTPAQRQKVYQSSREQRRTLKTRR